MQKWEYITAISERLLGDWAVKIIDKSQSRPQSYQSRDEMFRDLGEQGWELVSASTHISPASNTGSSTIAEYFYFKRPIE
ncbi:MAG: hypothetical protein OEY93_06160 [Anaerolineae bacterium]|nr:hypothetical protein [Anaerolineae bacterium]